MKYATDPTADKGSTFPAGDYFLKCTGVQDTDKDGNAMVGKKGHEYWILEMTVTDGPFANRKLWHYLNWIPPVKGENNGHGMTLKCLKAFGVPIDRGEVDIYPEHLDGVTVSAKVKVEPAGSSKETGKSWDAKNAIDRFYEVDTDRLTDAAADAAGEAQEPEAQPPAPKPAPAARQPAPAATRTPAPAAPARRPPWR